LSAPYHNKALPEGTTLREWRLEHVLGVGGFGIVYRAKGVYFDELVAIKEYFPSAISDRQDGTTVAPTDSSAEETYELGLQKFVEEAKVLWNLSKPDRHPNIVSVRSLFEIHGTAYMVMDFESGVSLSQMLRDGRRFDEAGLLALVRPIAEGLDRAHRAGVLHRDIKPANILVDDTGRPVLIDFGSARFDSGQATSTKVTFYTPPYAAIEQYVKTYPQGPWTDIYALGVTLYQCVTGEKPPEVLERLHGGLGEALSARDRPGFSRAFTRAVDAAMAIRPAERPQSIPEWLRLFDLPDTGDEDEPTRIGVLTTPPATTADPPAAANEPGLAQDDAEPDESDGVRQRRPWLLPAASAVAVALIAVAAALLFLRPSHPPSPSSNPSARLTSASAAAPQASPQGAPSSFEQDTDGLIADAQRMGRPPKEVAALVDSKAKIAALGAQIRGLASTPGASAKTQPLVVELNGLAAGMSRGEAAALGRAAQGPLRDVEHTLAKPQSGDASNAVAAVRQAEANLDAAIAAVSQVEDADASIDAARRSLAAYGAFADADAAATRFFAPAKRAQVADLDAQARVISSQIAALAGAPKPWLFASQSRKQAYQLLQDNAAHSKAQMAQLDQLSQSTASTSDLKALDAAVAQASAIKQALASLYEASSTASRSDAAATSDVKSPSRSTP
jgi:serine/threonine protein kinase